MAVLGGFLSGDAYASPELFLAAGDTRQRPEKDGLTYRDPPAPKTTNLSNGVELTFVP
jgi:hypothetical protein